MDKGQTLKTPEEAKKSFLTSTPLGLQMKKINGKKIYMRKRIPPPPPRPLPYRS
jgi:hypothetical protein